VNSLVEYAPAATGQDEVVVRLTAIWQRVLGLQQIVITDDYFDLGGDSVRAVQLFAEIDRAFHIKLPLATLYEATTIEAMAQLLRDRSPAGCSRSLVAIQPGGWRPPLFLFHGAGGNVLNYQKLAQYLGPDQPVYGLQARGLDGSGAPLTSIEGMAAEYLEEIRRIQPNGPYLLGGYCMGGTLAYEAAQQLQRAGEEVAVLALLDTMNWHKVPLTFWSKTSYGLQRLWFHLASFFDLGGRSKRTFVAAKWELFKNRVPVWLGSLRNRLFGARLGEQSDSGLLASVWQINDQAAWRYVPQVYSGIVLDVRPAKQYRVFDKPDLKWRDLACGGDHVIVLPVYPAGMLLEPYVEQLAAVLATARDAALEHRRGLK
jgi:thioesterase domain-containing protein/aryl carrier-like protein